MPGLAPLAVLAGLGTGYEQNQQQGNQNRAQAAALQEVQQRIAQMKLQIAAQQAAQQARGLAAYGGGTQPSLTGAAPPPPTATPPTTSSPMAPAGPPQTSAGPSTPPPTAAAPPAAPAPSGGPPTASGGQADQFSPQALMTMRNTIVANIRAKAPPDTPDDVISEAADDYIDSVSKLAQIVRPQAGVVIQQGREATVERGQDLSHEDREAANQTRAEHYQHMDLTAANRAATYAEFTHLEHEDRIAAIEAMNARAAAAINDRDRQEASKEAAQMQRLDEALENKDWATVAQIQGQEFGAQARSPTAQPGPPPTIAPPPKLGSRGGGAGAAAVYKSPQDVAAAFKAGKINEQQARTILKSQFGID